MIARPTTFLSCKLLKNDACSSYDTIFNDPGRGVDAWSGPPGHRIWRVITGTTDLNGSIFEMIMAGTPIGVALKEISTHHLVFGHLVQCPAPGRRRIVFIDHFRAESEPDYLPRLIAENGLRYVIWNSALPLYGVLVNGSIRQDYRLANEHLHVFSFDISF